MLDSLVEVNIEHWHQHVLTMDNSNALRTELDFKVEGQKSIGFIG